jgi:molybdopterin-containing oxidoreductase family iron-sulfur binding subunit
MAASAALAAGGCKGPPQEAIVPYVQMPEQLVPGNPVFYATAFVRRGLAHGVLVESNDGRPTKVEGNPLHPASLGATDVFTQASILQLWDPDRSQTVRSGGEVAGWPAFETALLPERARWQADGGRGLRILTGGVTSPTLAVQIGALLERLPQARWHQWDPLHDERGLEGGKLAFGRPFDALLHCDRASVIVSFDADFFGDWPGSIPYARAFLQGRNSTDPRYDRRLYVAEPSPSLTGAMADSRLAAAPGDIEWLVRRVAARFGLGAAPPPRPEGHELARWERRLARVLAEHRGRSLVVAGGCVPAHARAMVHALNERLGNAGQTVSYIEAVAVRPESHLASIHALADDMRAGMVSALFILGANPAYDAPADTGFVAALGKVPFSVHLGLYQDETGRRCRWHLPLAHDYERWGDALAFDGTASIVQPLIAPLYNGRSEHELLALAADDPVRISYDLVRRHWQGAVPSGFDEFWRRALRRGVLDVPARPLLRLAAIAPPAAAAQEASQVGLAAVFAPDLRMSDGAFSNNAWLQELPHPLTRLTWDNAALLSPATAKRLRLQSGDIARLADGKGRAVEAPVWVLPGHADECVTLPLGYGRQAAGSVGNGVGFNAYLLRSGEAMLSGAALSLERTGRTHVFAEAQGSSRVEGRDLVRTGTVELFRKKPSFAQAEPIQRQPGHSLYPQYSYPHYRWGMAIDLNSCIGCGACTIACQAENNIPVVGKAQVLNGREMHWIRVDRYYEGPQERPRILFQPVPCMHCENAPCEEVCPVGATMHDSEGLNVQVYNRCVGTRFCSNNCPYKVRRFNFLQFADNQTESLKAQRNPEVTVRRRGVMEKCNYCLQRITRARIDAEVLGRTVRDGEVVTACQAVCPTQAIVFGDLNDPASQVNRAKASPLDYLLLAELNTRPRTSYGARLLNPDPELG